MLVALGGEQAQLLQATRELIARALQLIEAEQRGAEVTRPL